MPERDIADQWLRRCAQRLQHVMPPDEATDLAHELLASMGIDGCPERAADELLRMPAEI
jgi:hypothetical protein